SVTQQHLWCSAICSVVDHRLVFISLDLLFTDYFGTSFSKGISVRPRWWSVSVKLTTLAVCFSIGLFRSVRVGSAPGSLASLSWSTTFLVLDDNLNSVHRT